MSAIFTSAVYYEVHATCMTPFRTAKDDTENVLRRVDHRPMIQGTSIAGALREWFERSEQNQTLTNQLFGSQEKGGALLFSDGVFTEASRMTIRPRVVIDGKKGTAKNKFDLAHMEKGSEFTFSITLLMDKENETERNAVEKMLFALHSGEILLGGQKTNGFGRVSLTVYKRAFDMTNRRDRSDWLSERNWKGKQLSFWQSAVSRDIQFNVKGNLDSVLVKDSDSEARNGRRVIVNQKEAGVPVLPASSVKGVIRQRVETIAALLLGEEQTVTENLFGREAKNDDMGKAGKVRFSDVILSEEKKQEISRIRINRFTGGVIRRALFSEEPLASPVTLSITVPSNTPNLEKACGLLVYALRDLGMGLYNFGSGASVGRGYLSNASIKIQAPDNKTATLRFDAKNTITLTDDAGLVKRWLDALEEG